MMKKIITMMLAFGIVLSGCSASKEETAKEENEIVEKEEETNKEEKPKLDPSTFLKQVQSIKTHKEMEGVEFDDLDKYGIHIENMNETYYVFNQMILSGIFKMILEDDQGITYHNSLVYVNPKQYPTFKDFVNSYYNGSVYQYAIDNYYSEDGLTVVYAHYDKESYDKEEWGYYKLTYTNEVSENGQNIILLESATANHYTKLTYEESVVRMCEVLEIALR